MRKGLAGVLLLSLIIGLFSSLHLEGQSRDLSYLGYDESVYHSLARHVLGTSPFEYTLRDAPLYFSAHRAWYVERPVFHHPPLFTWLLAFSQLLFGSSLLVGRFLNVLLGTLNVYVVYLIARRLSDDERIALASGFFLAVSPLHVQLSSLVLMDGLLALLVSLFVLSTLRLAEDATPVKAAQAGLFLGLALLTKYSAILALPILVLYAATRRITFRHALTTLGVALALNSWWLLWNLRAYSISFITDYGEFWRYPNVIVPVHAYISFLPVVAPAAIFGYLGVTMAIKEKDLKALGLASVVIAYFGFFSLLPLKEMRFVLPALPPLIALGTLWVFGLPKRPRNALTAILALLSLFSTYVVVKGGYFWYLPFWHLHDWPREFLAALRIYI